MAFLIFVKNKTNEDNYCFNNKDRTVTYLVANTDGDSKAEFKLLLGLLSNLLIL